MDGSSNAPSDGVKEARDGIWGANSPAETRIHMYRSRISRKDNAFQTLRIVQDSEPVIAAACAIWGVDTCISDLFSSLTSSETYFSSRVTAAGDRADQGSLRTRDILYKLKPDPEGLLIRRMCGTVLSIRRRMSKRTMWNRCRSLNAGDHDDGKVADGGKYARYLPK